MNTNGVKRVSEHEKVAAAQILQDIQSGNLDLDQLDHDKLAEYQDLIHRVNLSENEAYRSAYLSQSDKTASAHNPYLNDQGTVQRGEALGKIAARSHWNELQALNQDAMRKEAAAELEKLSGSQWIKLIQNGRVDLSKLAAADAQYILQKIASTPVVAIDDQLSDLLAQGKINHSDLARQGGAAGSASAFLDPAQDVRNPTPRASLENYGTHAKELEKDPGMMAKLKNFFSEMGEKAKGGLSSAGSSIHGAAGRIGGAVGAKGGLAHGLGYGAMGLPLLAAGGLGAYALSGDDKTASGLEKFASACSGVSESTKIAAAQWTLALNEGFPINTLTSDELDKLASAINMSNLDDAILNFMEKSASEGGYKPTYQGMPFDFEQSIMDGALGGKTPTPEDIAKYDHDTGRKLSVIKQQTQETRPWAVKAQEVIDAAKGYASRAGSGIHSAAHRLGAFMTRGADGMVGTPNRALGYGAMALPLAVGGGLLAANMGGEEKQASAQTRNDEVVKVAQAILLQNGVSKGITEYDAGQIHRDAVELLRSKGWQFQ